MSLKKALTFFGWPLLVLPTLILWTGMTMNQIAIHTNDAKMPVYVANCAQFLAPRANPFAEMLGDTNAPKVENPTHRCMTPDSHAKILGDIIVSNDGIASIGDILEEYSPEARVVCYLLWATMLCGCVIRKANFYLE